MVVVKFKKLQEYATIPRKMSGSAAGFDLHWSGRHELQLAPDGPVQRLGTGVAIEIADGFEGQIRSRSGLAYAGVFVVNSPGTIDADYRGEIQVLLKAIGPHTVTLLPGDRIAQLVIAPALQVDVEVVDELSPSARGAAGFGSTGR